MTTMQAHELWPDLSVNTIRKRCAEGMIPSAEKSGAIWSIPPDAVKPILTRRQAVTILKTLRSKSEGASPKKRLNGEELTFLADLGLCSRDGSIITTSGKELIETDKRREKKKTYHVGTNGAWIEVSD